MAFLLRKTSAYLLMLLTIVPTFPLQLSLFLLVLCSTPLPVTDAAVIIFPVHDDTILYQDQDLSVTPIPVESHQKCWEECVGEGDDSDYCEGKGFSSMYEKICWLKGDKSIFRQDFPIKRDEFDGSDENACWEECTGREGADAAYCEEICRNHDHGDEGGDHEVDNGETSVGILTQTVQLQGIDDENACWEECTSKGGADAEYCEEICRNHDHDKRPNDGNDVDIDGTLTKIPWKSGPYQNVNQVDDSREDEDACWEDCTGKEGADADYCEEICRNHDHGNGDDNNSGENIFTSSLQTVLQDHISSLRGSGQEI